MSAKIEQRVLHIDFIFWLCNLIIFIIDLVDREIERHKSMTYKTNTKHFYIFSILLKQIYHYIEKLCEL